MARQRTRRSRWRDRARGGRDDAGALDAEPGPHPRQTPGGRLLGERAGRFSKLGHGAASV